VLLLGPACLAHNNPAEAQQAAEGALGFLVAESVEAAVAAVGAVPLLVQMLGTAPILRQCPAAYVQRDAAGALMAFAAHAEVAGTSAFAAAGAIPPLVQMLGPGTEPQTQWHAAAAIADLSAHADNKSIIAAAGGIPLLFKLMGRNPMTKAVAARALGVYSNAEIRAAVAAAAAPSAN
jgi:hypothetical protein